jgi:hypothetical protein
MERVTTMTDNENEYEQAIDFFTEFEGVSKRALNVIPKNTLLAIKRKIDENYILKEDIKELELPEPPKPLDEPGTVVCHECEEKNFDFMYDDNGTKYPVARCIYCGADLYPPPPIEIRKKYKTRPFPENKLSRYPRR